MRQPVVGPRFGWGPPTVGILLATRAVDRRRINRDETRFLASGLHSVPRALEMIWRTRFVLLFFFFGRRWNGYFFTAFWDFAHILAPIQVGDQRRKLLNWKTEAGIALVSLSKCAVAAACLPVSMFNLQTPTKTAELLAGFDTMMPARERPTE